MTQWSVRYNNEFTDHIGPEEYAFYCHQIIRERELMHPFIGDSRDYYVLNRAAQEVVNVPGLFCEIGLRRGGGLKSIIDGAIETDQTRTVISIDPFGAIPFEGMEGEVSEDTEYTNEMQHDTLEKVYRFLQLVPKINFIYFPLEDTEFFKRYDDGVPVYKSKKTIENEYALVHFDGPHTLAITMEETEFFLDKTKVGSRFVYDDVAHFYSHDVVKNYLEDNGWGQVEATQVKASYVRLN